ncbi:MAG: hypothetical protein NC299_11555 [Lachnospiraceae bacterium]|nr:hypothetical protein [Ruminococcus sp.]MCM1275979.1 hypothetical protein [Lachnospiraceae bacterium]
MKKIVSAVLVSAMLLASLTACNNDTPDESSSSSSSTVSGGQSSDNNSTTSSSTESSSSEESSSSDESSSSTEESSEPIESDPEGGEDEGVDNSGLPYPDNTAGNLTKAILANDNWPAMDIVTDAELIPIMFSADFDLETCEEFCFATNIISAQLNKVIVVKPKAGSEEAVSAAMDGYFEAVKNDPNIAFYPGQQASADGAVKGQTDDGYLYIIVHENGAAIESAAV